MSTDFHFAAQGRRFLLPTTALIAFLWLALSATAEDTPLWQQEPYDIVRLIEGHMELKVETLKLPNHKLPENPKPTDKLEVHLVDQPDKDYEPIEWKTIEKVILFEDMLLAKANELVAAGKAENLEAAYDYFKYLYDKRPNTTNLDQSFENYLYEEAKISHRNQKYDEALALMRQIYAKNPKRQGLDKAMGVESEKLIEQYIVQRRYNAARALIQDLNKAFPNHPIAVSWNNRIHSQAESYLRDGQAAVKNGDWSKASEQCRLLTAIWPGMPGAKELADEIQKNYPRIVVGVMSPPQPNGTSMLSDWSARRDRRLFYRTLTEYLGPGMEGGKYLCPVGTCTLDTQSLGRRLLFQLKPDIRWPDGQTLSAYDVSRRLWLMADPGDAAFSEDWAELFKGAIVRGATDVEVEFRRPHVRPESLLQTRLVPYGETMESTTVPPNGPFLIPLAADENKEERGNPLRNDKPDGANNSMKAEGPKAIIPPKSITFSETVFRGNPQYFATKPGQPKELVIRHYPLGEQAVQALKRGEIEMIDRIAPWNLHYIKNDPKITIGKYCVPTVHCLIPNFRRPLVSSRTFRRALSYGLNRDAILGQIVGGDPTEGCRVVSGPFPAGISNDDPLNYAYDERIEPRECNPRMAVALSRVGLKEYIEAEKKKGVTVKDMPRLVLAYPENEIAQTACNYIKLQLAVVKIQVDLRPLKGPLPNRIPDDVDLLYAELAMGEPVTDASRLFGENGLAGGSSPYIALAIKQLEQASDWAKIRDQLHRLHRIAFDDAAVVPLWQLVDFYAYRKGNRGIGDKPATLYQNIEQWQPVFNFPDGE